MSKRYFSLFFLVLGQFLLSTNLFGQQIKPDKYIKVDEEQRRQICTLFPTDINANYSYAPADSRNKGIPEASRSEIEITYKSDCQAQVWPDDAKTAFQYAADLWTEHLDSDIPIRIEANWVDLGGNTLGSASPTFLFTLSGDDVYPNTFYSIAEASALTGTDLVSEYDEIDYDIVVNMSCGYSDWYFGTDANPPPGTIDAVTVLLHEIGHGIGFTGSMNADPDEEVATWGLGSSQFPIVFDLFAVEGDFNELIDPKMFPKATRLLYDALAGRDGGVFFSGFGAEFAIDDSRVPLYSPDPFQPGSSYSHVDQATFTNTENALMRPQIDMGLAIHSPGPIFCGILQDIGWPLGPACEDLIPDEGFLDRPALVSPDHSSKNQPVLPTLMWQTVTGAEEYRIQISRNFDFDDPVVDETLPGTEFTVDEALEFSTLYFWRVQALSAGGNSKFSSKHRFETKISPPSQITLLFPEDGDTQLHPGFEISWERVDGADEYEIQISKNPDLSLPVINQTVSVPRFTGTKNLDFSTRYYWRIRGVNSSGPGEWSETRSFTTVIERPETVVLNSPSDHSNQVPVNTTFSWKSSPRAAEYIIQISEDETFSTGVMESTDSETTFTIGNPLMHATIYYWRVKAVNAGGESDWSGVNQFTTQVLETAIRPNYPNPFNSTTNIRFQLSDTRNVSVEVFDLVGRKVATLVNEKRPAGVYYLQFQASGFASGTYFIRFVAGNFTDIQKMAIIK